MKILESFIFDGLARVFHRNVRTDRESTDYREISLNEPSFLLQRLIYTFTRWLTLYARRIPLPYFISGVIEKNSRKCSPFWRGLYAVIDLARDLHRNYGALCAFQGYWVTADRWSLRGALLAFRFSRFSSARDIRGSSKNSILHSIIPLSPELYRMSYEYWAIFRTPAFSRSLGFLNPYNPETAIMVRQRFCEIQLQFFLLLLSTVSIYKLVKKKKKDLEEYKW